MPVTIPAQLSVVVGTATVAEHSPITGASTGATGGVLSTTVTVKLQGVLLPEVSVATYVTVVIPTGKREPGVIFGSKLAKPQLSLAVGGVQDTV